MNEENESNTEQAWAVLDAQASQLDNELTPDVNEIPASESNQSAEIETAELLAPVIKVTADLIAPNWALNEKECEQLGVAYGALLDKYLPDNGLSNYGIEITAIITTGVVFGSRRGVPMRKEKPKEKQKNNDSMTGQEKEQLVENNTESGVLMPKEVADEKG